MVLAPYLKRSKNELERLHHNVDDLFSDFFGEWGTRLGRTWPAIDIIEKPDIIEVTAEVPGCKAEDIDISVQGNTLTIAGEKPGLGGVKPESVELIMKPKNPVTLDAKDAVSVMNVVDALEELDDVQNVYSALDLNDELMKQLEAMAT